MSFASYAQNLEDVMLWRALKHVPNGFYVDIGAQHPVVDSVSKAFYERGWRGIHVEPVPYYAELLRKHRPDETVLQVALGDTEGVLELKVIPHTGLSTAVDAYAERHEAELGYQSQRIDVPVLTLKSALQSLPAEVHWLKIDVEGFEEQVLKGWDSTSLRPWIILVEATLPNSPKTDYTRWDPILTEANYRFVYFDGLNRFYIAQEHEELRDAFSCPPNIFDDAVLALPTSWLSRGLISLRGREEHGFEDRRLQGSADKLRHAIDAVLFEARAAGTNAKNLQKAARERKYGDHLQAAADKLRDAIDAMRSESHTPEPDIEREGRTRAQREEEQLNRALANGPWRITAPLRRLLSVARPNLGTSSLKRPIVALRNTAKSLLWRVAPLVLRQPRLANVVRRFVRTVPGLEHRLRRVMLAKSYPAPRPAVQPRLKELQQLPPRVVRVYMELQRAVQASRNDAHRH